MRTELAMPSTKIILTLFAALVALKSCNGAIRGQRDDIAADRDVIFQFFNYIDINSRIRLDNMLDMTRVFVGQVLNTIPYEERGNSAEMFQQYIEDAEAVTQSDSLLAKEEVLLRLQHLVATINAEMVKQEPEDIKIRRGLMGMFELLARLSIEERKFNEKFVKGAKSLRQQVSPSGVQRNYALFAVVSDIEAADGDIVRREQLRKRFKEIRLNEYGSGYV